MRTPVIATAIAGASMHGLAITDDGLDAWGSNGSFQLEMTGGTRYTAPKVSRAGDVMAIATGYCPRLGRISVGRHRRARASRRGARARHLVTITILGGDSWAI